MPCFVKFVHLGFCFFVFKYDYICYWLYLSHQDPKIDLLRRFLIGVCAGIIGCVSNSPFDVVKSRIQGPQPVAGEIKYWTCFQTMSLVYREEG